MYLTQIKTESLPSHQEFPTTSNKPKVLHMKNTQSLPSINSIKKNFTIQTTVKSTQKPLASRIPTLENIHEDSTENITIELLQHIGKSNEILQNYQQKENKLITTIKSIYLQNTNPNAPSYKKKSEEILINFKSEAVSADRKISQLQEENKRLKEKLAMAMLEEVDERIKNETPASRAIERYAREAVNIELSRELAEEISSLKKSKEFQDIGSFSKDIQEFFKQRELESPVVMQLIYALCQQIISEKKKMQKVKIDSKKVIALKQEVAIRIRDSINSLGTA